MRIGIDIRSLIEPFPSGISEYTFQVIRRLLRYDRENKYILFYNSRHHRLSEKYRQEFSKFDAEIVATHWPNKIFNFILFLGVYIKLDKMIGGVDLFFMPNINFVSLSSSTKLVITVHDLSFEYPKYFSTKSKYWHKFIRPSKLIKKADGIIAVSKNTKQDIVENYKIDQNKISVIYSGVELKKYSDIQPNRINNIKNKYRIIGEYFLYLGNLENRKNIITIIEAWQKYKQKNNSYIQLVLAGRKTKSISDLKADGLIVTGYVEEDEKPALYSGAKAFIYPSFYEGFGLPVIEAMAAGCPVVTSFSTALPEIAEKAAILIDPYNINECAKALELVSQEKIRNDLLNKARSQVKKYDWEQTSLNTIKLFQAIK